MHHTRNSVAGGSRSGIAIKLRDVLAWICCAMVERCRECRCPEWTSLGYLRSLMPANATLIPRGREVGADTMMRAATYPEGRKSREHADLDHFQLPPTELESNYVQ